MSDKPVYCRASEADEYFTEERCHILELSNSSADPDASVARARVAPGVTTVSHCVHDTVERYVIQSGEGTVYIGDESPADVRAGDVVVIPEGVRQSVTNTGTSDLVFLCICTPRFQWSNYESLE